ncbi:helix-turn-helix transcriptional regulator [Leuconostoc gelidum subsp. gasicomitatum]|uniref:helix-turn-helix domain-containing protein n=1 Tax=Leuconostoc TaxID=1243 RepID=UPI001CBEEEBF|nr:MULTISPECIES: helix-turn-helix domain-containing protein [Leuconostoc]MBZ1531751.1 helix-turn-helix transcriptional regulator [Leuconostoc mesenteroides]MBZ5956135.1 helix-turn-helix transcriptional regulator [Leuconostoc gasicomitatum]
MSHETRITLIRKSKGLTQEKLAELSHLSVRTIQRLEAGDDSSLETLRLVANALNVSVTELFESVSDENKEKEINYLDKEQTNQIEKRKSEKQIFNIKILSIFILILLLAAFIDKFPENIQGIVGILWLGIFFLSLYLMKYMKSNWRLKMNEKYPLTRDLKTEKTNNIDDFLWWKQPIARNILMVFWSAIIPLIFILKYLLHVF